MGVKEKLNPLLIARKAIPVKNKEKIDLLKAFFATVFDNKTTDLEYRCRKMNKASAIQEEIAMCHLHPCKSRGMGGIH